LRYADGPDAISTAVRRELNMAICGAELDTGTMVAVRQVRLLAVRLALTHLVNTLRPAGRLEPETTCPPKARAKPNSPYTASAAGYGYSDPPVADRLRSACSDQPLRRLPGLSVWRETLGVGSGYDGTG
jgi:hypothetical protein